MIIDLTRSYCIHLFSNRSSCSELFYTFRIMDNFIIEGYIAISAIWKVGFGFWLMALNPSFYLYQYKIYDFYKMVTSQISSLTSSSLGCLLNRSFLIRLISHMYPSWSRCLNVSLGLSSSANHSNFWNLSKIIWHDPSYQATLWWKIPFCYEILELLWVSEHLRHNLHLIP